MGESDRHEELAVVLVVEHVALPLAVGRGIAPQVDDENHRQLFVPVGFAHGFCVLSDVADVTYLVSSLYDPATEAGIRWNDPEVGVEWPVADPQLSQRDIDAPSLAEVAGDLPF